MYLFYFILAIFISLLLKICLIFKDSRLSNYVIGDASVHLKIIDSCRKGIKYIPNYVIPNRMSYPILFHQFCTIFPKRILIHSNYLPNLLIYIFMIIFLYNYSGYIGFNNFENYPMWGSLLVIIIFSASVQNLTTIGPSIAYNTLSSRLLGKISTSLYFLSLIYYLSFDDQLSLFLSIFFSTIGFLSSTFAAQAIIFSTIVFSLISLSLIPILLILSGILFSILISKGYSWLSLTSMVKYWKIYKKFVAKSKYQKDSLSLFLNIFFEIRNIKKFTFKKLALNFFNLEPTRSIIFYPEICLLSLILFLNYNNQIQFYSITINLFLSVLFIYLLTTTKYYNFLGESYRYLEYSLSAITPVILTNLIYQYLPFEQGLLFLIIYLLSVIIWAVFIQNIVLGDLPKKEDKLNQFIKELGISENDIVFPLNMRFGADLVARSNCKSFWWQPGAITDENMFNEYISEYPYLSKNWKNIAKKHNVNLIIIDKKDLKNVNQDYSFDDLEIIKDSPDFIAYKSP